MSPNPDKVYRGERIEDRRGLPVGVKVTADGRPFTPSPRAGCGFEWGYGGAGPLLLARSLIADATGDRDLAIEAHRWFMWAAVACLGSTWCTTAAEVRRWLDQYEAESLWEAADQPAVKWGTPRATIEGRAAAESYEELLEGGGV